MAQIVFYIHCESPVRLSIVVSHGGLGRSGTALPNLPFTGFIQARSTVRLSLLQSWLDAVWTPVCSKLCSAPQYRNEFMDLPEGPKTKARSTPFPLAKWQDVRREFSSPTHPSRLHSGVDQAAPADTTVRCMPYIDSIQVIPGLSCAGL